MEKEEEERKITAVSGGAEGADRYWATKILEKTDHLIIVKSFEGHRIRSLTNPANEKKRMTIERVDERTIEKNQEILERIAKVVGKISPKTATAHYLGRDVEIANASDVLFAVGMRDLESNNSHPEWLGIDGGTGWTCQIFLERFIEKAKEKRLSRKQQDDPMFIHQEHVHVPLYFFDQKCNDWQQASFKFTSKDRESIEGIVGWVNTQNPLASDFDKGGLFDDCLTYGCIGTRKLEQNGRDAINNFVNNVE